MPVTGQPVGQWGAMVQWMLSVVVIRASDITDMGNPASLRAADTGFSPGGVRLFLFQRDVH